MSDTRDPQSAGAPVEESESSNTEVLAAVERSREAGTGAEGRGFGSAERPVESLGEAADADPGPPTEQWDLSEQRAAEWASDEPAVDNAAASDRTGAPTPFSRDVNLDQRPITLDDLPSAGYDTSRTAFAPAPVAPTGPADPSVAPVDPPRDGEIRISSDHPMAALYMQTPMPPDLRGNRGAGVLISLLATIAFAIVYAGVIALRLAPVTPPSQFLAEGLLPFVMSWGFISAVAAFLLGMVILVLIVGRAGWWAYVLGGFPVGVLVWAAAVLGYAFDPSVMGLPAPGTWNPLELAQIFGLTTPALGAAIVAREVTVWFGAWIGARGRRVSAKNARLVADYEEALAEVRSQR